MSFETSKFAGALTVMFPDAGDRFEPLMVVETDVPLAPKFDVMPVKLVGKKVKVGVLAVTV